MNTNTHNKLVSDIIDVEWQMFDKTNNEGGRADCQDNPETFYKMRTSQLDIWNDDTLQSYKTDLKSARLDGRNMIEEKYAYMMRYTAPEQYATIEALLPPINDEKQAAVDELVNMQVGEMDKLAKQYPRFTGTTMRALHSSDDSKDDVSFETYLRGELCTYSVHTLALYKKQLEEYGGQYSKTLLERTAALYGYASLEQIERSL